MASYNYTADLEELKKNVDNVFILTNAIIVCLMQCGFACLEAGAVRSKNTTNIIMKNVMDIFLSCISYWLVGYALAYGKGNSFIGWTYWAGVGIPPGKMSHFFFQFVFAATAATIVSGAVAERCNFIAYIVYSIVISGIVYPPISHWVWTQEGWLNQLGYVDFSGCGPVHLLGGVCSFFGAAFLGPRIGRFGSKYDPQKEEIVGHSIPLVGIGGMILIAGFLSFNGGSLGTMTNPGDGDIIARVITNTILGGTGGSLVLLFASKLGLFGPSCWSFTHTLNSGLIGMVSVCAGVNNMTMWAAFLCGVTASPVYMLIHLLMNKCKGFISTVLAVDDPLDAVATFSGVDDPLDAVAVHFGGGFWGLVAGSIFDNSGFIHAPVHDAALVLGHRMIGAATIIAWGSVACCIMFGALKCLGKLRVSEEQEIKGLDIAMHNEPGYHPMGWKTQSSGTAWQKSSVLPIIDGTHRDLKNRSNHSYKLKSSDFLNAAYVDTEQDGNVRTDSSNL